MRVACYCLLGFLGVWGTWTFVSAWLNCVPVAKFWNESLDGYCLDKKALWFSNSAIHIFTDIVLLIFPMPALKKLQLPSRQKIALMAVFALGAFVFVTSILRMQSLLVISESKDPTYDNVGAATWSAVECNVAIICACLPATRALISKLIPRLFSTRRSKNTSTPYNKGVRSRSTNLTSFRASVGAGKSGPPDYQMSTFGRKSDRKDPTTSTPKEITVTTVVSQESVVNPQDEYSSLRGLIKD
ncbi:putative integral membrane protein [Aspergillus lucknowensis]|uniref:Rhodopsin domain-containing protein n=1 Tax=Aspergillus lucknowensis TaxID=176173 RepID=A0ABR4M1K8_9EURO